MLSQFAGICRSSWVIPWRVLWETSIGRESTSWLCCFGVRRLNMECAPTCGTTAGSSHFHPHQLWLHHPPVEPQCSRQLPHQLHPQTHSLLPHHHQPPHLRHPPSHRYAQIQVKNVQVRITPATSIFVVVFLRGTGLNIAWNAVMY